MKRNVIMKYENGVIMKMAIVMITAIALTVIPANMPMIWQSASNDGIIDLPMANDQRVIMTMMMAQQY